MRLVFANVLKLVHVLLGSWMWMGWAICQTRAQYAMHAATCAAVAASWAAFGHCVLTVYTNRLEGIPDERPFVPFGLENKGLVYVCLALSAMLSVVCMLNNSSL